MANRLDKLFGKLAEWRYSTGSKSLRDYGLAGSAAGQAYVIPTEGGGQALSRLFRKQNVVMLRAYAEYSIWVRAALDIYRQEVAMAKPLIVAVDPSKKVNEKVKSEIERKLGDPNRAEEPYSDIKEKFLEDYLVIGHGAIEKEIRLNGQPIAFYQLDAARVGFVDQWDGTDLTLPRYALFGKNSSTVQAWIPDAKAMVLVNRPRSYDKLGLSHVEALDQSIRALLENDQLLINEIINPTANGMIDLGSGVPPRMVSQIRSEIEHLRRALLVIANSTGSRWHSFDKMRQTIRELDRAVWFVRQVAAVFQIPMAKLQIAVDQSRANTEAQFDEMDEGPSKVLERVRDLENANITLKFGKYEEHNCIISYPALTSRDEALIARVNMQGLGGGQAYISINDARRAQGLEPLDPTKHPGAEDIWFKTGTSGPVPLSVLELKFYKNGKPVEPEPVATDAGGTQRLDETDDTGKKPQETVN